MTDQEIRLKFGEMNAGEMRLARALVAWHELEIVKHKDALTEARQIAESFFTYINPETHNSIVSEKAAEIAALKAERDELDKDLSALLSVLDAHDVTEGVETARYWKQSIKRLMDERDKAQAYDRARPQAAEIAKLKAALAESEKQFQAKVDEIARLLNERDKTQGILKDCLSVMPFGNIETHTVENLPHRIADLASELAAIGSENERLEAELAAAPDLLEALEAIMGSDLFEWNGSAAFWLQDKCRAAIAKAKGGGEVTIHKELVQGTPAVGDTVRLKSGGPAMTVTNVDPLSLMCAWMNASNELQVEPITTLCLEPAQP